MNSLIKKRTKILNVFTKATKDLEILNTKAEKESMMCYETKALLLDHVKRQDDIVSENAQLVAENNVVIKNIKSIFQINK